MANVVDAVRVAVASRAPCSSNSITLVSAALSRYRSRRDLSFVPTSRKFLKFQPVRGAFLPANRRRAPGLRRIVCEAQDTVAQVQNINEKTFKSVVLESDIPVLVDFWAPWCGPCRMIEPLIDELAKQYSGKIKCVKVNTDESPNIATEYGIRSIPTVMIFKDGQKKDTVIGAVPKTTLCTCIEKFVEW